MLYFCLTSVLAIYQLYLIISLKMLPRSTKQLLYLPKVRTNYGKSNIRYCGSVIWNSINSEIKSLKRYKFKASLKKITSSIIPLTKLVF